MTKRAPTVGGLCSQNDDNLNVENATESVQYIENKRQEMMLKLFVLALCLGIGLLCQNPCALLSTADLSMLPKIECVDGSNALVL